jgi:ubiquinone/menaquinone biosynthesis C-methylase UbiE
MTHSHQENPLLSSLPSRIIARTGYCIVPRFDPLQRFRSDAYLRNNARRQEHLASLHIPVAGMSVLEVGAGIGDHSHYFLDRGCRMTITETRESSLAYVRQRFPSSDVRRLDMEYPPEQIAGAPFDIVYCYGLLYHLSNPAQALEFFRKNTGKMLLLETCVSFAPDTGVNLTEETQKNPTQAFSGMGCRPSRSWVWDELSKLYPHVYVPQTQPNHEEFPTDWNAPKEHGASLQRAIFVASLEPIRNEMLTPALLMQQRRHE